jgi:hypothetical protein
MNEWLDQRLKGDEDVLQLAKRSLVRDVDFTRCATWTLDDVMSVCRVVALDSREMLLGLGTSARGLVRPLTAWVEQKAVKLARQCLHDVTELQHIPLQQLIDDSVRLLPTQPTSSRPEALVASTAPVVIVKDPTGLGNGCLTLSAAVPAFSTLLSVPSSALFNLDTVRRYSPLGGVLHRSQWRKLLDDDGEAILLAALVYERALGKSSHWANLFETCPSGFPFMPLNWDEQQLAGLAGTSIVDEVVAKQAATAEFTVALQGVLKAVADVHTPVFDQIFAAVGLNVELSLADKIASIFDLGAFTWARCVFDSRALHLNFGPQTGADKIMLSLAPVVDMINHNITGTHVLTRRINQDGELVLETGAELPHSAVGTEITMSYGPLQTWELLLSYGFVPPDGAENENDRLPFANLSDLIPMDPEGQSQESDDESAHFDAWKRRIVKRHALNVVDALYVPASGIAPPLVRAVLRLCQAEADDFPALEVDPFITGPAYLERRVSDTLAQYAASFLESVDPPSDADVDDDKAGGTRDELDKARRRMASVVRSGLLRIAQRLYEIEAPDGDDDAASSN